MAGKKIWKVYVNVEGDTFNTNAMEYETREEAETEAKDLFRRWLLVKKWEVREEPPRNRVLTANGESK